MPTLQQSKQTIRFNATLAGPGKRLILPAGAASKLPAGAKVEIEAVVNTFPFRSTLQRDGDGNLALAIDQSLLKAIEAADGETVSVEITRAGDELEVRLPKELSEALAEAPASRAGWDDITPNARRDWVLSIITTRNEATRLKRVGKAIDMLASGKRRICCFPGLTWLRKEHPDAGESWISLSPPARVRNTAH